MAGGDGQEAFEVHGCCTRGSGLPARSESISRDPRYQSVHSGLICIVCLPRYRREDHALFWWSCYRRARNGSQLGAAGADSIAP